MDVKESNKEEIRKLLDDISKYDREDSANDETGYYQDKNAIKSLFEFTRREGLDESKIRIRLTVLDSMYSTQMRMHPYGLEDLAKAIWEKCHKNYGVELKSTLTAIAADEKKVEDEKKISNLFCGEYGVETNKAKAVSLISKYFYFETNYQFPIYDSIVRKYLPLLYHYCGIDIEKRKKNPDNNMCELIEAINKFFREIKYTEDRRRYDYLDHLLWVIGKILRGNLSLVLKKEKYKKITEENEYKKIEPNKNKDSFSFIKKHKEDYEAYINKLIEIFGPDGDLHGKIANIALELINTDDFCPTRLP